MGRQDVEQERDRYRELLEELRTILPGVQVLFAFLLTAPFSARFSELDQLGRAGFAVALASAALSTVLFLAPTSFHRLGPRGRRQERLSVSVGLTFAGMVALFVAIASSLFVVTRFVFGSGEGLAMAAAVALTMVVLWYLLPILRRINPGR